MVSRRDFLKISFAAGAGLFIPVKFQSAEAAALAQNAIKALQFTVPTLDPDSVQKFVTPLLIPPVMPARKSIKQKGGKNVDYYEISVRQFTQQILPGMITTVWGYGDGTASNHHYPSFTIEARWNSPLRVKWINDLVDGNGNYLPHLLPIDQTLHWANPPGRLSGRDRRPMNPVSDPYTGPVPLVTHVHGAHVSQESDGYPEMWYLPDAVNIPADYAKVGTFYDYYSTQFAGNNSTANWQPGSATFQYSNDQNATTLWYHDHTLGMTRNNVYAGPAGFYLIRGGPGDVVLDGTTGLPAVLPGPAPKPNDNPKSNKVYYEIPIVIQDRAFNQDGSLFFPDSREYFDGAPPPYIPDPSSDLAPIWNPEFFGNVIVVNGNSWPFQNVEQKRYRLRFLNGCNSRFLILDFNAIPGIEVWQIGAEGGFLAAPANLTVDNNNRLLLALAERADLIVDFTNVPVGSYVLKNVGPDEPFSGGEPDGDFDPSHPGTTGQIMQFVVGPALTPDTSTPPANLQFPAITPLVPTNTRKVSLNEEMSMVYDGPAAALCGTVFMSEDGPSGVPLKWMDPLTELPAVGATEMWEIYNFTADAHPIHLHLVEFQVVNREVFDEESGLVGTVTPPEIWETGFKDTVVAYPGQITRVVATFDMAGLYVWHCHIVDHEDNEMMRPYHVGPIPSGLLPLLDKPMPPMSSGN